MSVRGSDRNVVQLSAEERFWLRVQKTESCWIFCGNRKDGYGAFYVDGRTRRAHRYSLTLAGVAIPSGHVADHVCRNRACVNPDHLRVVTPRINSIENNCGPTALNAAKARCKRGHLFSETRTKKGARKCFICQREHSRRYKKKCADVRRLAGGAK